MPQEDKLHPAVVKALENDGWMITQEQIHFLVGKRNFWIDIQAEKHGLDGTQNIILLEVKGFSEDSVNELRNAIGQYVIYQAILSLETQPPELYLAVSQTAYNGILNERIGSLVRARLGMKIVVVDENLMEVTDWIT